MADACILESTEHKTSQTFGVEKFLTLTSEHPLFICSVGQKAQGNYKQKTLRS